MPNELPYTDEEVEAEYLADVDAYIERWIAKIDKHVKSLSDSPEGIALHLPGRHDQRMHGRNGNLSPKRAAALRDAAIKEHSDSIRNSPFEVAVVLDDKGRLLLKKGGDQNSVVFTRDELMELKEIKGLTLIHNHPGESGSFSPPDVALAAQQDVAELRVVTGKRNYILKRPENGWGKPKDIYTAHRDIQARRVKYATDALRRNHGEDWRNTVPKAEIDRISASLADNSMFILKAQLGLDYTVEAI